MGLQPSKNRLTFPPAPAVPLPQTVETVKTLWWVILPSCAWLSSCPSRKLTTTIRTGELEALVDDTVNQNVFNTVERVCQC